MGVHIHIESSHFYDWEVHPKPEEVTEEDLLHVRARKGHDGKMQRKARFAMKAGADRGTTITISDDQLKAHAEYARIKQNGMTRNQLVYKELIEKVLPYHLHPGDIESLTVPEDPELEQFLNLVMGVKPRGKASDAKQ